MASRQSGFATVVCVAQQFINNYLRALVAEVPAQAFELPWPVTVDDQPVYMSGELRMQGVKVQLDTRPDDRVLVTAKAAGTLAIGSPAATSAIVDATFDCKVLVKPSIELLDDRFVVGLDFDSASVEESDLTVSVTVPGLHSVFGRAFHSQEVRGAVTQALRSLPRRWRRLTPDGIPASQRIAPPSMPCGASLFEVPPMFEATVPITRVEARPMDGALVLGIDFAGTTGDRNGLMNLFREPGPVIIRTSYNALTGQYESWHQPVNASVERCSIAVSVNPAAMSSLVVDTLAPAARYAFLDCHVALRDLGITFGTYQENPPLRPYWIQGAQVYVNATYYSSPGRDPQTSKLLPGGSSADVQLWATVAMHRSDVYSPIQTELNRSSWVMTIHDVDIDLPWWITFGLLVAGLTVPVINFCPLVSIPAAMFSLDSILGNLENRLRRTAQGGLDGAQRDVDLSATETSVRLPGLRDPLWTVTIKALSMNDQGIELFASYAPGQRPPPTRDAAITVDVDGQRVYDEAVIKVSPRKHLLPVNVRLDPMYADTGDPEVSGGLDLPDDLYAGEHDNQFEQVDWAIPHSQYVQEGIETSYAVGVRVYRRLAAARSIPIGSCDFRIDVSDRFDVGWPYVRWSHRVNGYYERKWNGANRRSAIHWTDPNGRCKMLDQATHHVQRTSWNPEEFVTPFEFLQFLTFPSDPEFAEYLYAADEQQRYAARLSELVVLDRDMLCDYCFFGGPDKTILRAPIITRPQDLI